MRFLRPVSCTLAALLLVVPATAQFGKNKVQYEEFDWQIYHSPHFDMYYYSEEEPLLEKVVSLAESAYDHLSREFDFQIQEPTPLIFYRTHSHFEQNNIILGFIPEGTGAFASPVRFRMVLPVDLPDKELYELVLHELTHIFQYHILFRGKLARGLASQPPTWLMEGMASYYAKDESTSDKMYLRDAVVNDLVPPITQRGVEGFFAYRFGHAALDFMEERWGKEGVLDFLYEFRNTLGPRVGRALEKSFRIEAEDFDLDFRRWLRKKYLPQLVETGEPSDFGRPFYWEEGRGAQHISPAVSPSGDLVASFGIPRDEVDIVLFDTQKRRPVKNLTKGFATEYQYLSSQFITSGRRIGRDLAFSPDGNQVASLAKREEGRSLILVDVLNGGVDRVIDIEVEQPFSLSWSPDGSTIAFAGNEGGHFDIFLLDLASEETTNLTQDDRFDGGPAFSPDGKSLLFSSEVGEYYKIFRLELGHPQDRYQITEGDFNDIDATYAPDGKRVFFASDRGGHDNVYGLDLESGKLRQHTNAVTGCFMPMVLARPDGTEDLIYTGYWRGNFDLYRTELDDPLEEPRELAEPQLPNAEPVAVEGIAVFEPDILVTVDDSDKEEYGGFHFFLEDVSVNVGVTSDQLFVSQSYLQFSDYLGDKRLFAQFSSVSSFSNFNVAYFDLSHRWQWSVNLFDNRTFFLQLAGRNDLLRVERDRLAFQQTGALFNATYPFGFSHRVELGGGAIIQKYDFQGVANTPNGPVVVVEPRQDEFPILTAALVGDTATYASWGPIDGRRWRFSGNYAPDLEDGGTLTASTSVDFRQYVPLTRRSNLAFRFFGGASFGNFPNVFFFGGLDDFRASDFRALSGDRAFYANAEVRFPLIDQLTFPGLRFQGIRGRLFIDIAGAWYDYLGQDFTFLADGETRLQDAVAAYGWGLSVNLLGLQLHWDFAKATDLKDPIGDGDFRTNFWIGRRF